MELNPIVLTREKALNRLIPPRACALNVALIRVKKSTFAFRTFALPLVSPAQPRTLTPLHSYSPPSHRSLTPSFLRLATSPLLLLQNHHLKKKETVLARFSLQKQLTHTPYTYPPKKT
jgi:hypothetical protein